MTSSEVREQGSFHCSMNGAVPGELPCVGSWERPASYGVQMPTIKADLVLPLLCVSKMLSQIGFDCIVSFFFLKLQSIPRCNGLKCLEFSPRIDHQGTVLCLTPCRVDTKNSGPKDCDQRPGGLGLTHVGPLAPSQGWKEKKERWAPFRVWKVTINQRLRKRSEFWPILFWFNKRALNSYNAWHTIPRDNGEQKLTWSLLSWSL